MDNLLNVIAHLLVLVKLKTARFMSVDMHAPGNHITIIHIKRRSRRIFAYRNKKNE